MTTNKTTKKKEKTFLVPESLFGQLTEIALGLLDGEEKDFFSEAIFEGDTYTEEEQETLQKWHSTWADMSYSEIKADFKTWEKIDGLIDRSSHPFAVAHMALRGVEKVLAENKKKKKKN